MKIRMVIYEIASLLFTWVPRNMLLKVHIMFFFVENKELREWPYEHQILEYVAHFKGTQADGVQTICVFPPLFLVTFKMTLFTHQPFRRVHDLPWCWHWSISPLHVLLLCNQTHYHVLYTVDVEWLCPELESLCLIYL